MDELRLGQPFLQQKSKSFIINYILQGLEYLMKKIIFQSLFETILRFTNRKKLKIL